MTWEMKIHVCDGATKTSYKPGNSMLVVAANINDSYNKMTS